MATAASTDTSKTESTSLLARSTNFLTYLGDKLVVPVLLAVVAFALGPYVSQHWQDHHAEITTKASMVDAISHASAELMSAVETRDTHPELETTATYYTDFRAWQDASQQIQGQIASYFPTDASLRTDWIRFSTALRLFHALPDQPKDGPARSASLDALYSYANTFSTVPNKQRHLYEKALAARPANARGNLTYQSAWRRLAGSLIAQRDTFVAELVHSAKYKG
jgi:hypothetical protein